MSPECRRLLVYLIKRRWLVHVLTCLVYVAALLGEKPGRYVASMYGLAVLISLFRVSDVGLFVRRATQVLPMSRGERDRLLWIWVYLTPLALLGIALFVVWSIAGLGFGRSVSTSAVIALYLLAPFTLALFASRVLHSRFIGALLIASGILYLNSTFNELIGETPSPGFLSLSIVLAVVGLAFPLWARRGLPTGFRRLAAREIRLAKPRWRTGIVALIWIRVRDGLVMSIFVGAVVFLMGLLASGSAKSPVEDIGRLLLMAVCMSWISNIPWLFHFRTLRCLPLTSAQLTVLTLAASVVPAATVWIVQYIATRWLFDLTPVSVAALLGVISVQVFLVPISLHAPDLLRFKLNSMLLLGLFLGVGTVAATGLQKMQPGIGLVIVPAVCVLFAARWTYREITQGHSAYRVPVQDWAETAVDWMK